MIDNVKLFFKQDPSEFKDDTKFSPVIFKKLQIFRDHNGVINVQPVEKNFKEYVITDIDNTNIQSMKTEIELLRKRLTSMSYIKEENETLRQYQEENTLLRFVSIIIFHLSLICCRKFTFNLLKCNYFSFK